MKKFSQFISLMMAALLIALLFLPMAVSAATTASVSVSASNSSPKAGDTVTFSIGFSGSGKLAGMTASVQFSSDVFDYISCTGADGVANKTGSNTVKFVYNAPDGVGKTSGSLGKVTLRVKSGAASGKKGTVSVASAGASDSSLNNVTPSKGSATVTVTTASSVKVTGVSLDYSSLTKPTGSDFTLKATVNPSGASNKEVRWESSNSSVATVSNGRVITKAAGQATIKVTTKDGGYTAACKVTVTGSGGTSSSEEPPKTVKAAGISLSQEIATVQSGKGIQLSATVTPSTASNKAVTWKTSDSSIATVDSGGYVTALKTGTVTITATSNDGGYSEKCTLTVTEGSEQDSSDGSSSMELSSIDDDYSDVSIDNDDSSGISIEEFSSEGDSNPTPIVPSNKPTFQTIVFCAIGFIAGIGFGVAIGYFIFAKKSTSEK